MDVGTFLLGVIGYLCIFKVVMTILKIIEWNLQNKKKENKTLETFLQNDFEENNEFDILKEELK